MRLPCLIPALILLSPMALAEPSKEATAYVEGNVLAIFYHELGHALIDVMALPVLGQEEDAADVLSVVLTDQLWEEAQARQVARATALSFLLSAQQTSFDDVAWWGVHGPDLQRHFNTVCLFYGADPELRADFAEEFGLPDDRAEGCADEYGVAASSWGVYLDEMTAETPGESLRFLVDPGDGIAALLAEEVSALNETYRLPVPVDVVLEDCAEANAFYDPSVRRITMCREFVELLQEQAAELGL